MRIVKSHISNSLADFFHTRFNAKFGLTKIDPTDYTSPMVVFGCYTQKDVERILIHQGLVVLVWAGNDAKKDYNIAQLRNKNNIIHIAQSPNIYYALKPYPELAIVELKVSCTDIDKWKPVPLGDKIYIYTSETQPEKYGVEIYTKLIEKFGKDRFIISTYNKYTEEQMRNEIYPHVKIALRLTPFDGLSESVIELGLMGRLVIHNNDLPNCINYDTFEEIVEAIKFIDSRPNDDNINYIHDKMYKKLNIGTDWLNTKYYGR